MTSLNKKHHAYVEIDNLGIRDSGKPKSRLRRLAAKMWRVSLGIVLMATVGGLIGLAVADTLQEKYRSSLLLAIAEPPEKLKGLKTADTGSIDSFVDGQIALLRSTKALRSVVEAESLTEVYEFRDQPQTWLQEWTALALKHVETVRVMIGRAQPADEAMATDVAETDVDVAIRKLRDSLQLMQRGQSGVIELSVDAGTPERAQKITTTLAQVYISERTETYLARSERVAGLLDEQTQQLRGSILEANKAISNLRREHGIFDVDASEPETTRLESSIRDELLELQATLLTLRTTYDEVVKTIAAKGDVFGLSVVQASELIYRLRIEAFERRIRIDGLRRDNAPAAEIRAGEQTIVEIEERISKEIARIVGGIEGEIRALQQREGYLQRQLTDAQTDAQEKGLARIELAELERAARANQELLSAHLSNAILENVSDALFGAGVQVIEPASRPSKPLFPTPNVIILIGLVAGAGLGALFGLRRQSPKTSAKRLSRKYRLPVLSTIPLLDQKQMEMHTTHEIPQIDPGSKFDKAVESLSYEIEDYETAFQASVVQLTSSEDGEGKSSVASALAASVAAQGLSVLLVDADLPNAGLSSMMGMTESRGLIELIKDGYWDFDDAALGYGCVDVVPAGNGGRRNVGLGGALVMRAYLEEARDRYDLILIDGPSVNNSADALILAELSDHIVFIVRKNWGSKESLTRALFQLDQSRIAGLVLNAA